MTLASCDKIMVNGVAAQSVVINGVTAWSWKCSTPGNVTIEYGSVTGSHPETVTGGSGSFIFTPPKYTKNVDVAVYGGGGGGGGGQGGADDSDTDGEGGFGGGAALLAKVDDVSVIPEVGIAVTIGGGGGGGYGGGQDHQPGGDGSAGGTSTFSTVSSGGGAGG